MALLLILFVVIAIVGGGYIVLQVVRQHGRILMRLDAIERELATMRDSGLMEPATAVPARGNRPLSESQLTRSGLPTGTPAPAFTLPRVGGGELSLLDYKGKNILLVFSDPHCGPCMKLALELEQHHKRGGEPNIVMVSRGEESENACKVAELGLTFPIVIQRHWDLSREYGMFATPIAFLIDENGTIARNVLAGGDAIKSAITAQT